MSNRRSSASPAAEGVSTPEEPNLTQPRRRRAALILLVAVALGAGVWLLIRHGAGYSRLIEALHRVEPWWWPLALVGLLTGYLGYALLYQAVVSVDDGPRPALPVTIRVAVAVFGSSVIATAAGRLGGEYWSMRRMREAPPLAWARVLALNTGAWGVLAGLASIGGLALLLGAGSDHPPVVAIVWPLVLPVCVPPAMFLSSPKRRRLAEDTGGRFRRTAATVVRALVLLRVLFRRDQARGRGLAGGLLYWAGELLVLWTALRAFGIVLDPAALVVAYATGYVSTMLPLPAGGVGGVDAASTYALTLVGVPLGPALLATLVQRMFTYWLPLAIAITAAHFVKRLGSELGAAPRPAPTQP
jgi:uncharacterized membrane protein YbhN (UPF0104 family)